MRGLIGTILHFRFLVAVLAAVLMVFGIIQLRHVPADVLPEFSPPYVEIQTEALGLSAEEVEQLITVPLEHNLNGRTDRGPRDKPAEHGFVFNFMTIPFQDIVTGLNPGFVRR